MNLVAGGIEAVVLTEVFVRAQACYQRLQAFLQCVAAATRTDRVRMVAEYLLRHKAELAAGLALFQRSLEAKVLATTVKHAPACRGTACDRLPWVGSAAGAAIGRERGCEAVGEVRREPVAAGRGEPAAELTVDDLIAAVVATDQCLITLYEAVLNQAPTAAVREVFQTLLDRSLAEMNRIGRLRADMTMI